MEGKLKKMSTVNSCSFEGDSGLLSPVLKKMNEPLMPQNSYEDTIEKMSDHYKGVLVAMGEDSDRQGLKRTPERAAKAMMFFTKGYRERISGETNIDRSRLVITMSTARAHVLNHTCVVRTPLTLLRTAYVIIMTQEL